MKFINILSSVISEQKRFKFDPETYTKLLVLTDKLWANRNKEYDKKTEVDHFQFKTSNGTDALVKIYINPRYRHFGELDTRPKGSRDPMDLVIQLNPSLESGGKQPYQQNRIYDTDGIPNHCLSFKTKSGSTECDYLSLTQNVEETCLKTFKNLKINTNSKDSLSICLLTMLPTME